VLLSARRTTSAVSGLGSALGSSGYGQKESIRLLTTQREKVKVLLVLYDGGKHAEQVRFFLSFFSLLGLTPFPTGCSLKGD
jgi:hypothetical protein